MSGNKNAKNDWLKIFNSYTNSHGASEATKIVTALIAKNEDKTVDDAYMFLKQIRFDAENILYARLQE